MAAINVTDVKILNNPAVFSTPIQLVITFECSIQLSDGMYYP